MAQTRTRREFLSSSAVFGAAAATACASQDAVLAAGMHVAMLGDSIFDNASYVPGKPCVIEQMQAALAGSGGRATLLAQDGDVVAGVARQLARLPADATHLVVSAGGNDALQHTGLLNQRIDNAAELLGELATIREAFRQRYAAMLDALLAVGKPACVCTVYDSNFDPPKKTLADVALTVFNDAILRGAGERGVPVIDLRRIFTEPRDYANPIEPSEVGGAKMVQAILAAFRGHDFAARRATMYP